MALAASRVNGAEQRGQGWVVVSRQLRATWAVRRGWMTEEGVGRGRRWWSRERSSFEGAVEAVRFRVRQVRWLAANGKRDSVPQRRRELVGGRW